MRNPSDTESRSGRSFRCPRMEASPKEESSVQIIAIVKRCNDRIQNDRSCQGSEARSICSGLITARVTEKTTTNFEDQNPTFAWPCAKPAGRCHVKESANVKWSMVRLHNWLETRARKSFPRKVSEPMTPTRPRCRHKDHACQLSFCHLRPAPLPI